MTEIPETRRDDVVDVLHGESVADPYRWLEDTDAAETSAWVKEQNQATSAYLESLPGRDDIRARLTELWQVTKYGVPHQHGDKWFFTRHDADADQPVLLVSDDPSGDGRLLLDPNMLSEDGTVALASWAATKDASKVVYALTNAGSDWLTWRVRDVATGEDLPDVIEWSKFCEAAWLPDGSGFFYNALDEPAANQTFLATNDDRRLQLHLLGQLAASDELIYADPREQHDPDGSVTDSGEWLVINTHRGTDPRSTIKVLDLADRSAGLRDLVATADSDVRVIDSDGTTFYVLTDADAPRKRIVAIDLDRPQREHWREVIAEGNDTILDATSAGGRLVTHSLHDASSRLQIWSLAGKLEHDIELPPYVSVTELSGGAGPLLHVGVTSFIDPASVWSCDVTTGGITRLRDSALPIDADAFVVTRASAPSTDGTEIPMFLVHRKDTTPDGTVPTLLYGYGGFDIPVTPTFNAGRLVWVERGGLLAVANLRGGGEFGKEWYDAGKLANKQNVFDDFAGCARWLAASQWTRADRIVINGGSNGGLLVGAVLTQHPQLIGAAVPEVGVLDMLRYHKFTIGWAWMSDYGNPDDPEQYPWVRAFSPLHNLRPGTAYPATMVMTGDHDDRVVPGHSFKFAAALQYAQRGSAPVLVRIETSAGHGHGMPVSKQVEARADMLAFCEAAVRHGG